MFLNEVTLSRVDSEGNTGTWSAGGYGREVLHQANDNSEVVTGSTV